MTAPAAVDPPVLRVVIYREAHYWLAQGLEHDVGVQAERLTDLVDRLSTTLEAEMARGPLDAHPPAPPYFQWLWRARAGLLEPAEGSRLSALSDVRVLLAMVA